MAGEDSNPGTSPSAPRRTFKNAIDRFNSMSAGDTVAFCRGGAWDPEPAWLTNTRCAADATCDVRDYVPAGMNGARRPIFRPTSNASEWSFIAAMQSGTRTGYRFLNLDVRHTGHTGITFNLGSTCKNFDICNVAMSGGDLGVLDQATNESITVRYNQFSDYAGDAILAGSNHLLIDSNLFLNAGAVATKFQHVIYLQGVKEVDAGYFDERIVNNDIQFTRPCLGVVIVNSGRNEGVRIENNQITSTVAVSGGCYGISVGHGSYPFSVWHKNAIIRRNRVILPGSQLGIAASVCVDCQVTDNLVVLDTAYDALQGIVVPGGAHRLPGQDGVPADDVPDATTTGVQLRNNTVYLPRSQNVVSYFAGVGTQYEGTDAIIENNVVWTAGGANTCYQLAAKDLENGSPAPSVPTKRYSNNYCRSTGGALANAVFVDPVGGDFRPAPQGPLVGFGSGTYYSETAMSPVFSPVDVGVTRTAVNGATDAGAFVH